MFLKWIVCDVPPRCRDGFHAAQKQWSALSALPGFLGQVGGWEREGRQRACILSFWQDPKSHQRFMDEVHDDVTAASGQADTYSGISVRFARAFQTMPGEAASSTDALADAGVLRVAECRLRPEREDHFLAMQAGPWTEAMRTSDGMLNGLFSTFDEGAPAEDHPDTHFLTTFWRDEASHRHHVESRLPGLLAEMRPEDDLVHLTKRWIALEPEWRVLPTA